MVAVQAPWLCGLVEFWFLFVWLVGCGCLNALWWVSVRCLWFDLVVGCSAGDWHCRSFRCYYCGLLLLMFVVG